MAQDYFMAVQSEIRPHMRKVLASWMHEVRTMLGEILFISYYQVQQRVNVRYSFCNVYKLCLACLLFIEYRKTEQNMFGIL